VSDHLQTINIKHFGRAAYEPVWRAMHSFTDSRSAEVHDELWLVEHDPVFTQGQAGKEEHLLNLGDDIPLTGRVCRRPKDRIIGATGS